MAKFSVTSSELKTKASRLRELNGRFKTLVSSLETTEGSLNSMWEGEAREAFHTAFTSDKTQMNNFYNAVELYAQRLEEIAAKYETAENNAVNLATNRTYC